MKKKNELPTCFEDLGIEMPDLSAIPEKFRTRIKAEIKLMCLAEKLNEGWVPDWNDWDQYKYYPYFYYGSAAGVGCVYSHAAASSTSAYIGSRLCFRVR
jgi:hypothetical protein